ncbi:MAG: hypothetical protein IPM79_13340 [Polyangiaceae bacterium]|nr:hypothetical protein [Polyangiaceae bacterium]MBK8938582.1 hypothetical protein [Polyangiaceae bacterium]
MSRTKIGGFAIVASTLFALATPSTAHAIEGKEKAGRWMFNIRVGAAANLGCGRYYGDAYCGNGYRRAQFVLSPEIAVGLDREYNAYLGIIPMFQVGDGFTIINVPLTFQYDIELPVKGLYIYPKVNAGYSRHIESDGNYFMLEPAVGIKYQFHKNVHFGGEPLGFPFYIGEQRGRSDFAAQYHFFAYIGFDV